MDMNKIDKLMAEVRECRSQLELAWQDLDYAQVDYIDSAIFKIKSLEKKHKCLCDELKYEVFPKKKEENKFKLLYKKLLTFIK